MSGRTWEDVQFSEGPAAAAIAKRLAALDRESFLARLWSRDPAIWGSDPAHQKVAANRLGWLGAPTTMKLEAEGLEAFTRKVVAEGFTHAVLLGMGGSSLAPEVLGLSYPNTKRPLALTVLDNTSPAAVRAVEAAHDPTKTLFIVASKSGGTIEVASFERHFFEWVKRARQDPGRAFVAVTDPDTALQKLAGERGYRAVFTNPPDIGGRYSALSLFGLLPAALIGIDVETMLDAAIEETRASEAGTPCAEAPGVRLGAALGELARAGRDKVTILPGPPFEAFGVWAEQLIAESTGKIGRGIVPVAEEALAEPSVYANDRVFVAFSRAPLPAATLRALQALETAGHPVLRWRTSGAHGLAMEFLRWEIATVTAGAILGVDPFDEPNVTEAKQATQAVLDRYLESGGFAPAAARAQAGGVLVEAPDATATRIARPPDDPGAWLAGLTELARDGDYVALLAYMHRTPERHERLERLRLALRARTRRATTLGYGPRFLHSTGQLHKGGPNTGVFIQLTADEGDDIPIPGERYGFAALRWAQAAGDYEVLTRRERRVIRVRLGADVEGALDRLAKAV